MRSDLVVKLLGVLALGLPVAAFASSGASPEALVLVGIALVLAMGVFLSPLSLRSSGFREIDDGIDAIEESIDAVREERSEVVLRAKTAVRFREEFVAAVRHELKTPLNAILGFADVLLQEVDGPLNEMQREDVDAIRSAGVYLRELVEAVLSEWRPRRDTPLPFSHVDVRSMLRRVARILTGQVRGREIELKVELPEPVGGPLADERRLQQVIINLGTNALRATERGQVTFSAHDAGDHVCFSVRDTGSGIDPDALPTLFQQFERGVESEDGAGLGLALAREMVEWHGGYIEVETQAGVGSVFRVMIPKVVR